ncbi:MAG: 3-isopropylmalate dehydratase small subunit [Pseudomonadota bacterium]
MAGWSRHEGRAVALPLDNVDTDQLIPARFMSAPRAEGYGQFLLHDLRRDADGVPESAFPLNRHKDATVLIVGKNFGSGSSRESAVYALVDAGIRVVVAPSFGDIFAANAVNNGLLPAQIATRATEELSEVLGDKALPAQVDLEAGKISLLTKFIDFELDESWRAKLINGWDDIDLTLQHRDAIATYRNRRRADFGWALRQTDPENMRR